MKILVVGAKGFLGKNLFATLERLNGEETYCFDIDNDPSSLDYYTRDCEFVFHLAGVNRTDKVEEFMAGNYGFTKQLLMSLQDNRNACPILVSSSIQAALDNPYGRSKKAAEDLLFAYGKSSGARVLVYRLPNVFGKWCRPNYNSVIATFCHNIARDLPIYVNDPAVILKLVYIDDVVEEFLNALHGKANSQGAFYAVPVEYTITLGEITNLLYEFRDSRVKLLVPNMADDLTKKLYATYLSYLPEDKFAHPLKMNLDNRGSFTEVIRTPDRGQISVNISRPGIIKGNHWHHSKNEKFLVVSGTGVIRFRSLYSEKVIEYFVNGDNLQVVDIPPGYTHNIENLGVTDLVTLMWANEPFDSEKSDTYFLEV